MRGKKKTKSEKQRFETNADVEPGRACRKPSGGDPELHQAWAMFLFFLFVFDFGPGLSRATSVGRNRQLADTHTDKPGVLQSTHYCSSVPVQLLVISTQ